MKRIVFFAATIVMLSACGSTQGEKNSEEKAADTAKAAAEMRTNLSFLNDFNALEGVFGNENWMAIDNKDTSYCYFSRLGNFDFNTYQYRLVKGDSANVVHAKMQPQENRIAWQLDGKKLLVNNATPTRITAVVAGDTAMKYEFLKLDEQRIRVTYPDRKQLEWKKTIPFSLYLVRSRYDYAHGTRYAFDTGSIRRKK